MNKNFNNICKYDFYNLAMWKINNFMLINEYSYILISLISAFFFLTLLYQSYHRLYIDIIKIICIINIRFVIDNEVINKSKLLKKKNAQIRRKTNFILIKYFNIWKKMYSFYK